MWAELAVLPPNLTRQLDTLTLAPQIGLLWRSFSCPLPTSTHAQLVNWRDSMTHARPAAAVFASAILLLT